MVATGEEVKGTVVATVGSEVSVEATVGSKETVGNKEPVGSEGSVVATGRREETVETTEGNLGVVVAKVEC